MALTREDVLQALKEIKDPVSGDDLVSAGLVRALNVDGGSVRFVMEIDPKLSQTLEPVRAEAEARLKAMRDAYLTNNGVTKGDADSYCRLGLAEIEKNSLTGWLLRAN